MLVCVGLLIGTTACVAQSASSPAPVAAPVKPGLWETTIVIESPATTTRRSVVGRTCVTSAEVGNLARLVPVQREAGLQCENKDVRREGAAIVWTISCKSADNATHTGKGRLAIFGESYSGSAELDVKKTGVKGGKQTESFTGKWIQACG